MVIIKFINRNLGLLTLTLEMAEVSKFGKMDLAMKGIGEITKLMALVD